MMWFKQILWNWVREVSEHESKMNQPVAVNSTAIATDGHPSIKLVKAINGTVLQYTSFTPDKRHPFDGTHNVQNYVLKEGDDLVAAIATILMNEKLK